MSFTLGRMSGDKENEMGQYPFDPSWHSGQYVPHSIWKGINSMKLVVTQLLFISQFWRNQE